jgi:alpha-tubulin suppressor-like RCC1 family protein
MKLVDAGQDSVCAISNGDALYCWGASLYGHLGNGGEAAIWNPLAVLAGRTWGQVATDTFHSCGLDERQQLYCWGRGLEGQLGVGDFREQQLDPIGVDSRAWLAVSVGRFHTCGVTADERVWCTGLNEHGQVGPAAGNESNVFVEVLLP